MSVENLKKLKSEKGFTIVELLIVIVVIGILAAIVIVAYNGVTNRANATKAKTNAATVQKVAEAYNADMGVYPTIAQITAAWTPVNGGTQSSQLPTGLNTSITSAANVAGLVDGEPAAKCTSTSSTATCLASDRGTVEAIFINKGTTGGCIGYYDYTTGTTLWTYAGNASSVSGTGPLACN